MTPAELDELIQGDELLRTLDVKTLVLDILREMPEDEYVKIFWDKLPQLDAQFVRDYLYMKRQ